MAHCFRSGFIEKVPLLPLPINRQKLSFFWSHKGRRNRAMENMPNGIAQVGYRTMTSKAALAVLLCNDCFKRRDAVFWYSNEITRQQGIRVWVRH